MYQNIILYLLILFCSVLSFFIVKKKNVLLRKQILCLFSFFLIFFYSPISTVFIFFYITNIYLVLKFKNYFIFGYIFSFCPLLLSSISEFSFLELIGTGFLFVRQYIILIDVKDKVYTPKFIDMCIYFMFFPTFSMGPLEVNFKKFIAKFEHISFNKFFFIKGLMRISIGILFIYLSSKLSSKILNGAETEFLGIKSYFSITFYLFSIVSFTKSLINFIGIIEIAIGSSLLYGIKISENFRLPFIATNIQNFWNRYHITMGSFIKRYIFFPIFFKYENIFIATITSFILFGLWHNFSVGFLLWGIIHGMSLSLFIYYKDSIEKLKLNIYFKKFLGWLFTYSIVAVAQTIAIY